MEYQACKAWSNLRPLGRTVWSDDALALFWTGSGIECMTDSSELWLEMRADFDQYEPWISVELDGAWFLRMPVPKGESRVCLFRGLTTRRPRRVRILKDVQPMQADPSHLLLFTAMAAERDFLPLPAPACRLAFIGDSITSGEGALGPQQEEDWVSALFSAENNYAKLTADALGAEFQIVSQSGWGVLSGWDNNPTHTLPRIYPFVCGPAEGAGNIALGAHQPYDFTSWKADAVIINLGTNDDGAFNNPQWTGPHGEHFQQHLLEDGSYAPADAARLRGAVVDFLGTVRRANPTAKMVWAYGMLGHRLAPVLIQALEEYRAVSGDEVTFCLLPDTPAQALGARQHPGIASHRAAADVLIQTLHKLLA